MSIMRHLWETVLNPFFLILLLLALSLFYLWRRGDCALVRWGFTLALLFFLLFSTGWLPKYLTRYLEDNYPVINKPNAAIRWVVVLSGGQSDVANNPSNSILYSASIKRLVEAIRLYRQLPAASLVLSGGGYGTQISEAQHLGELAAWFSIPSQDIILETVSINTIGQIKAISPIVKQEPFYLVTSAIHMPRAMRLCKAQGLYPIAAPTDFTYYWNDERWAKYYLPNPHNLVYLSIAMHEVWGMAWMKIRGLL